VTECHFVIRIELGELFSNLQDVQASEG